MEKTKFTPHRSCFICPYRQEVNRFIEIESKQNIFYPYNVVVWGRVIPCVSLADARRELAHQATIEVAFARHNRPLSMSEYLVLSTKYSFTIDEQAGKIWLNNTLYGWVEPG